MNRPIRIDQENGAGGTDREERVGEKRLGEQPAGMQRQEWASGDRPTGTGQQKRAGTEPGLYKTDRSFRKAAASGSGKRREGVQRAPTPVALRCGLEIFEIEAQQFLRKSAFSLLDRPRPVFSFWRNQKEKMGVERTSYLDSCNPPARKGKYKPRPGKGEQKPLPRQREAPLLPGKGEKTKIFLLY